MSDLASWALRGLRGQGAADEESGENDNTAPVGSTIGGAAADEGPPLSPEEVRRQRLERMQASQNQETAAANKDETEPMDVDKPSPAKKDPPPRKPAPTRPKPTQQTEAAAPNKEKKKRKQQVDSSANGGDSSRKMQRKKEIILRKSLQIALANTSTTSDTSVVVLETGSTEITAQSVSEILALRLSLTKDDLPMGLSTQPLLAYLAQSHRTASEEFKTLQQSSRPADPEILDLLKEIQRQVVNYAATCLQEPDLFAMAEGASMQLAKCLSNTLTADALSIAFGVNGPSSSFYYCLVEELLTQDADALGRVVNEIVDYFTQQLSKVDNVLDDSGPDGSALQIVMALVNLCMHKKVALAVSQIPSFLLPAAGTTQANEQIAPPMAGGNRLLQQFMAGLNPPYRRRSGPGLEKHTLLGLCLRVGIPKNNPAFPPANISRQTIPAIEAATKQQRGQLRAFQTALNQLLMNLIKGGPDARARVMDWFQDALLVNVSATASRPDPSKVSSQALLLNLSVVLLKFCEPFVKAEAKHALIDIGFLSSPSAHGGVFATTGDWAVDRLGESGDDNAAEDQMDDYNPKNAFIPHVCFFTARSLHFSLASMLSQHDGLLRSIGHAHWMITNRGGDLASDPHFGMYVARQRSQEVSLYQEDMVEQALRFCDLLAKVLYTTPPEEFKHIPEHFVSDICDILTLIAKRKPRLLRGLQFGETFRMVVKLLSPTYASMVRNYNLRARLGDTLYEIFLPSSSDGARSDVPATVYTDPAVGQSYMLADSSAQETLAPSLLLLYGEVEHTGYYDKMSHRAKISSIIQYLWESREHRPAFRRITHDRDSFIKFANGIMNETNTLIATVMQKLPEIREAQIKMKNHQEWGQLTEEQQKEITDRLEDNEREVQHALPLCNKTLKMFGYLNTDAEIRSLFLLDELCPRLVQMLLHVLTKLVGSKGLELKVDNPEELDFKPKIMLQDLCRIFSLFAEAEVFATECARSACDPALLRTALKTVRRLSLLTGDELSAFESLPDLVEAALEKHASEEELLKDAPEEFMDEILDTLMSDPVLLPSGHVVDRSTIAQHLLNDPTDPFNRSPLKLEDVKPAVELQQRITVWIAEKKQQNA